MTRICIGIHVHAEPTRLQQAIGAADEGYGLGPCWEMDYNIRAARAGFRGVWAGAAYVHRAPFTARRRREEAQRFSTNKHRYQDKFCALRMRGERSAYASHCHGEGCEHFAPSSLIPLHMPLQNVIPPAVSARTESPPRPSDAPAVLSVHAQTPLVSCIMPTRQCAAFALQAIRYFQRQDYPERELIIIDDGPEELAAHLPDDPRIRYLRLPPIQSISLEHHLASEWRQALAGDRHAQSQWCLDEGGEWTWQADGVCLKSSGTDWAAFGWKTFATSTIRDLQNFVVEVTISGQATAAGLSFGPYKDFLTHLDAQSGPRRLQVEVDVPSARWAFRIDGALQHRAWWDAALHSIDDIVSGRLFLKAQNPQHVLFQDLTIHTFHASCRLSVIMTCHRFLQRLRISLRNWCHQSLPSGAYEVLVINPDSPDGTHEYLAAVARSYSHVRIREVAIGSKLGKNKGALINHAVKMSRGEWIWLTDADCLFAPTSAAMMLDQVAGQNPHLFYGQRRHLTASQTDALLTGRIDGLKDFETLSRETSPRAPENELWGYTQILHRSTLERLPYRQDHNHFAYSDMAFIEDCKRHRILPKQVTGLFCLHMDHPFAWYGTDMFL